MLKLMYITNNSTTAIIAEQAGVDRIFVDLEYLGKDERQKGLDTVISQHNEEDILSIKGVLNKSKLLVRVNPINPDSEREINTVVKNGADIIMLPMFRSVEDVKCFLKIVDGRIPTVLLLEHIDAVNCLDDILEIKGINEIHIGLNDLHISMNLTFMFELFSNGLVEKIAEKIKYKNIPFGIGGIGRIGTGMLPAEMILTEHYRLGSTAAILSRSFCNVKKIEDQAVIEKMFIEGVKEIRLYENFLLKQHDIFFAQNRVMMANEIRKIVCNFKGEIQ